VPRRSNTDVSSAAAHQRGAGVAGEGAYGGIASAGGSATRFVATGSATTTAGAVRGAAAEAWLRLSAGMAGAAALLALVLSR
jgi:hypothetical protein